MRPLRPWRTVANAVMACSPVLYWLSTGPVHLSLETWGSDQEFFRAANDYTELAAQLAYASYTFRYATLWYWRFWVNLTVDWGEPTAP